MSYFTEMAIFSRVAGAGAIANDATSVDVTQAAVFAGVGAMARIDQLAIVQRNFADQGRGKEGARVEPFTINYQISYATDETCRYTQWIKVPVSTTEGGRYQALNRGIRRQ